MIAVEKVMAPVDFSKESLLAVKFAASLVQQYRAKLYVMHVLQPLHPRLRGYMEDFLEIQEKMVLEAEKDVKKIVPAKIRESIRVETVVEVGNPHHAIVEKAKELEIDVLVIATHGRTGFSHVLIGSVAEKVIRHAPCPVFVVRDPKDKFVYGWE